MPELQDFEPGAAASQTLEMTEYSSIWDDLGVTNFIQNIKAHKRLAWMIPVLWIVFSNLWFLLAHDEYQGQLQIIPASAGMSAVHGGGLSSVLSGAGLGGLLSGGNGNGDEMFSVYVESWRAPWFAQDVLNNQGLAKRIFYRDWSDDIGGWRPASRSMGSWVKEFFGARSHPHSGPNVEQMLDFLNKNIVIQHNRMEMMTLVTLQNRDPLLIRDLLSFGHKQITEHLRQVYQQRAKENVSYLLNELQHVTVTEYRTSLTEELAQQEKIGMMAYANQQFVSQSFGIYVTSAPVFPRLGLVLMGSFLLAVFAYCICVLVVSSGFVQARLPFLARTSALQFR